MGKKGKHGETPLSKMSLTELLALAVDNKGEDAVLAATRYKDMDRLREVTRDPAAAGLTGYEPATLRNKLKKAAKVVTGNKYANHDSQEDGVEVKPIEIDTSPAAAFRTQTPVDVINADELWEQQPDDDYSMA